MAQIGGGKLLDAVTVTGDGPVLKDPTAMEALAVQAEITGAPTACVINVMGLIDGGTFDTLCTLDINEGYVSGEIAVLQKPVLITQIKGNLATLTGGSGPTVSLYVRWRH